MFLGHGSLWRIWWELLPYPEKRHLKCPIHFKGAQTIATYPQSLKPTPLWVILEPVGPTLRSPHLDNPVGSAGKGLVNKVSLTKTSFQTNCSQNKDSTNAKSHHIVRTPMPRATLSPGHHSPHQLPQLVATPEDCRVHSLLRRTDVSTSCYGTLKRGTCLLESRKESQNYFLWTMGACWNCVWIDNKEGTSSL